MKTNIYGKTKAELLFELVTSLNQGNTGYTEDRVSLAEKQYAQMVSAGIVKEIEE